MSTYIQDAKQYQRWLNADGEYASDNGGDDERKNRGPSVDSNGCSQRHEHGRPDHARHTPVKLCQSHHNRPSLSPSTLPWSSVNHITISRPFLPQHCLGALLITSYITISRPFLRHHCLGALSITPYITISRPFLPQHCLGALSITSQSAVPFSINIALELCQSHHTSQSAVPFSINIALDIWDLDRSPIRASNPTHHPK